MTPPITAKPRRDPVALGLLLCILAVALFLRLHGFNWDDGQAVHPDERAVEGWTSRLQFPHNPLNLFNARGTWNPGWNPATQSFDPSGFNYGSLPLYLIYIFSNILQRLATIFPWWSSWRNATNYPDLILAGRVLSAFADTVTVFLVYLIGTRLAGRLIGIYAAALATFSVLMIQLAHFTTVDTLLGTFATGTVLASIDLFARGRPRDYIIVGIWLAAAFATKVSALPLISVVLAAHLWRQGRLHDLSGWRTYVLPLITTLATTLALFIFQPFMFFDWGDFWTAVQIQNDLARGTQIAFYTRKWAGTKPIIYPFQQLTLYSLGLPLATLAYAGLIYEGIRVWTRRRNAGALIALFVVAYFLSAGTLWMKYLRYMLPIVPALCVLAALFVGALLRAPRITLPLRVLGVALGGLVLLLNAAYGLAYENIYAQPLTRIQATCWMFQHIPSGTPIAQDNLDETLPVGGCDILSATYPQAAGIGMPTYDDDTLTKVQSMAAVLSQAHYYIIGSRRAMDTFSMEPKRSPYTHRFYQLLFSPHDPLGFTLVKSFIVHPKLGFWTFSEAGANQNFDEYDHPPVYIFKNTRHLQPQALVNILTDNGRLTPQIFAPPPKSLLLTPADVAKNLKGPSYGQMFPADSLPMRVPILAWLVIIELIGLLTLPIAIRLFGRLPDAGFIFAKTAGILLLSWFAWILASLHLVEYSRGEIALCLLPIAAISLLWGVPPRQIPAILRARRVPVILTEVVFLFGFAIFVYIRALYPDMWHGISGGEKTMDFSFLNAIVRSRTMPPYDPWFAGGYLNYYYYGHFTIATLLKLAGITPAVAINLAIPTWFALALAGCVSLGYALVRRVHFAILGGVFAVVSGNLYGAQVTVGDLQAASPTHDSLGPVASVGSDLFVLGGIIDAVSFSWSLVTGFIRGTIAVLLGIWQVLTNHATLPQYIFGSGWAWDGSRVLDNHTVITEFPFWSFLFADPHAHMLDIPFALCALALAFNVISRSGAPIEPTVEQAKSALPGTTLLVWPLMGVIIGAIGPTNPWDLAEMLGAVSLALLIGRLLQGSRPWPAIGWAVFRAALLAVFSLGLYAPFYTHFQSFYSSIGFTILRHQSSLGDFFTVFGLFLFVLISYLVFAALTDTTSGRWLQSRARGLLFTLYYWDRQETLERYFRLARRLMTRQDLPSGYRERMPARTRAVVLATATLVFPLLINHYFALALIVAAVACFWLLGSREDIQVRGPLRYGFTPRPAALTVLSIGGLLIVILLVLNFWVLTLLTVMETLAMLLLVDQRRTQPAEVYTLHLLIVVGLAVAAAGEIVYVKDFYEGDPLRFRNNTVFKLYEEAWLMMGVAGAAGLARLLMPFARPVPKMIASSLAPSMGMGLVSTSNLHGMASKSNTSVVQHRIGPNGWAWAWLAAVALLCAGALVYPLRITPLRVNERQTWNLTQNANIPLTLDGMRFLKDVYPGDYQAIQWINQNIAGAPVILQSRHGNYRDFAARVTMFTGLPSVVNWGFEASQQRYDQQQANPTQIYADQIAPREQDVDTIYNTADPAVALPLLHKYHVRYIFVGYIERRGYAGDDGYPNAVAPEGLLKFNLMTAQGSLKMVYNALGTTIYEVAR